MIGDEFVLQDGLFSEDAWSLKTQFLHAYGYQLLPGLHNLESLGLLTTSSSPLGSGLVAGSVGDATGRLANKVAQVVSLPKRSSFQVLFMLFTFTQITYGLLFVFVVVGGVSFVRLEIIHGYCCSDFSRCFVRS